MTSDPVALRRDGSIPTAPVPNGLDAATSPPVSFLDTSVQRESACPVHFIWDGNGYGRPLVRVGFMLMLVAGASLTMSRVVPEATAFGKGALLVAVGLWLLGQVVTRATRRR